MKITKPKHIQVQKCSSEDTGTHLEVCAVDNSGNPDSAFVYPLLSIIAQEKSEDLMLELYTEKGIVNLPIEELARAIRLAKIEVHSKGWWNKRLHDLFDQGKDT